MNVRSYIALTLSANYWRFRRQREGHAISAFWVKTVFCILVPLWGGVVYSLLFQKVAALQPFRARAASGQTALVFVLWLAGWWGLHRFIGAHPEVYTDHLSPEGYRLGNVYGLLLLAVSLAVCGAILMALGNM